LIASRPDAFIFSGIIKCKNVVISHTGLPSSIHVVRLRVHERLNGIPLYLLSNAEIALQVEALFNFEIVGCITFEPGPTGNLLKTSYSTDGRKLSHLLQILCEGDEGFESAILPQTGGK
ncbi:unnamed protein product, partial [Dicrocoelium dendriticum]